MQNIPRHNPKQVEFIEQRRKTDCGIACLAMLCGCLYAEIASIFYGKKKTTRGGIYPDDMLEMLEDIGCEYEEVQKFPAKGCALVAVKWKEPNLSGHYVVWDGKRKQFLDPLHGVVDKDDFLKLVDVEEIWKVTK